VYLGHWKKLAVFFSLLCAVHGFSQTFRPENAAARFVQRLSWDADPHVFKYIVTIEREEGGTVEQRTTTDNYIEVSLPPGRYKYTVDVYNLIDIFDYRMPAVSFEVFQALQPSVIGWTPKVFNMADGNNEVLFSGANLVEGAQIRLVKNGSRGSQVITVEAQSVDGGNSARVFLPMDEIKNGSWTVYITNPGGLSVVVPGFRIKTGKQVYIDLSALYSPVIPIRSENKYPFGFDFFHTDNFLFDNILVNPFYSGVGLRLAWLPIRFSQINVGFLFEPYLADFSTDLGYASLSPYLASTSLSLLLQTLLLNDRLALHISAGGGMLSLFNFHITPSDPGNGPGFDFWLLPLLDLGVSIKIYPIKTLFIELGVSWNITFPFETPGLHYLKPAAGLGYSF
jgi:hypothetical protein